MSVLGSQLKQNWQGRYLMALAYSRYCATFWRGFFTWSCLKCCCFLIYVGAGVKSPVRFWNIRKVLGSFIKGVGGGLIIWYQTYRIQYLISAYFKLFHVNSTCLDSQYTDFWRLCRSYDCMAVLVRGLQLRRTTSCFRSRSFWIVL